MSKKPLAHLTKTAVETFSRILQNNGNNNTIRLGGTGREKKVAEKDVYINLLPKTGSSSNNNSNNKHQTTIAK